MKEKSMKVYATFLSAFTIFFASSVIGWIYEVLTIMIENHHGFQNRGVLFGPYLPIYGFGMLILVATVNPIKKIPMTAIKNKSKIIEFLIKLILVFIAATLVTTLIELLSTYLISPSGWEEDTALWYYSASENYAINFQGRIALRSSLRFGFGGTILLYVVYPLVHKVCKKDNKVFIGVSTLLFVLFIVDLIFTYLI